MQRLYQTTHPRLDRHPPSSRPLLRRPSDHQRSRASESGHLCQSRTGHGYGSRRNQLGGGLVRGARHGPTPSVGGAWARAPDSPSPGRSLDRSARMSSQTRPTTTTAKKTSSWRPAARFFWPPPSALGARLRRRPGCPRTRGEEGARKARELRFRTQMPKRPDALLEIRPSAGWRTAALRDPRARLAWPPASRRCASASPHAPVPMARPSSRSSTRWPSSPTSRRHGSSACRERRPALPTQHSFVAGRYGRPGSCVSPLAQVGPRVLSVLFL